MPTYTFHGRTHEGQPITGKRLAQTEDVLAAQLSKEGIIPIKILADKTEEDMGAKIKEFIFGKRINTEALSIFARQMYTLTSSGVPLTFALRQLAQTSPSLQVSEALFGIVENLEAGKDLASSMQQYSQVFSPLMINMIRVGQNSGRLDEAFLNLFEYLDLESRAIKQVKSTIRYPMIVLVTIGVAVAIVTLFVIPTFANVFARANIPLPLITSALIAFSVFMKTYWVYIVIALCILVFYIRRYLHSEKGQYEWHRIQLRLPIIGGLLNRILLLRFAQSFAIVMKSGIPLVEGIGLVAQSIQNVYVQRQIYAMQTEIQRGKTMTQAALSVTIFTPLELQMLAVSEETGEIGSVLEHLARYYQREIDYSLKRLSDVIEPILVFGLAILVLGLALAVYMPIWNMIKLVHS